MVYIIKEGEVEALRQIKKLHSKAKASNQDNKFFLGNNAQLRKCTQPEKIVTKGKDNHKPQMIRLSQICSGQMFGEEDVVNNRNYTTTVRCISTSAVIYCIKAEEFLLKLSKEDNSWQ